MAAALTRSGAVAHDHGMRFAAFLRRALAAAVLARGAAGPSGRPPRLKVALVIGNAAYPAAPLRNPVNDANAMAARLRAMGFEVTLRTNVTQREMTRSVSQFGQALKPGSVALFYYAGHGMQVRGRNFLIPVDADIQSEASARSESVDLDLVLEQLGPSRLSMVILDACRNNPFEGEVPHRARQRAGAGRRAQGDAPRLRDGAGQGGLRRRRRQRPVHGRAPQGDGHPGREGRGGLQGRARQRDQGHRGRADPVGVVLAHGRLLLPPRGREGRAGKAARDRRSQAELQAKLEAERRAREKDAQALKAEMEKLREEVRRLSIASAAAAGVPEAKSPASAAVPADPKQRADAAEAERESAKPAKADEAPGDEGARDVARPAGVEGRHAGRQEGLRRRFRRTARRLRGCAGGRGGVEAAPPRARERTRPAHLLQGRGGPFRPAERRPAHGAGREGASPEGPSLPRARFAPRDSIRTAPSAVVASPGTSARPEHRDRHGPRPLHERLRGALLRGGGQRRVPGSGVPRAGRGAPTAPTSRACARPCCGRAPSGASGATRPPSATARAGTA